MNVIRPVFNRLLALFIALLLLASCTSVKKPSEVKPDPNSFPAWRLRHQAEVDALERFLKTRNVDKTLATSELLRSASDWQACHAAPFAVPPRAQWESVASVLKLLQFLKNTSVINGRVNIYSGYRNATLNACAGGAAKSTHTRSFALDFSAPETDNLSEKLCSFWQEQGKAWNMGFSVYPSGRIHIDTTRYRTWGSDYTGKTTACKKLD